MMLLDPICLLSISSYHQKNLPNQIGASIGILYAIQSQLAYTISLNQPLGTNKQSAKQIISRLIQYQCLKSRKAKNNINYYDQYVMIGWYLMGSLDVLDKDKVKYQQISKAFQDRSAHFFLTLNNKAQAVLYKNDNKVKYSAQIGTLQKYCMDSMYFQSSKNQSALQKSLKKQSNMLQIYNEKLDKLQKLLKTCNEQKKRQILQLLSTYQRMEYFNSKSKSYLSQSINYNIVSGLILVNQKIKDLRQ